MNSVCGTDFVQTGDIVRISFAADGSDLSTVLATAVHPDTIYRSPALCYVCTAPASPGGQDFTDDPVTYEYYVQPVRF